VVYQQLVVVNDDFTRWLGELGYTVEAREQPVTLNEGPSGTYDSVEYQLILRGAGELDGTELRLSSLGVWWLGTQGMISLKGRFSDEISAFFREMASLARILMDPTMGMLRKTPGTGNSEG
jgi:hypothetical protein